MKQQSKPTRYSLHGSYKCRSCSMFFTVSGFEFEVIVTCLVFVCASFLSVLNCRLKLPFSVRFVSDAGFFVLSFFLIYMSVLSICGSPGPWDLHLAVFSVGPCLLSHVNNHFFRLSLPQGCEFGGRALSGTFDSVASRWLYCACCFHLLLTLRYVCIPSARFRLLYTLLWFSFLADKFRLRLRLRALARLTSWFASTFVSLSFNSLEPLTFKWRARR